MREYIEEAPAYTKGQLPELRDFIKKSIRKGDCKEVLHLVDHGKIRPSKSLQNAIGSMLKGKREFTSVSGANGGLENMINREGKDQDKGQIIRGGSWTTH